MKYRLYTSTRRPDARFHALDGLRGCCAVMVALYHFNSYEHVYSAALIRNSYLFVDFFFVLSGFVIACSYGNRLGISITAKTFLLRRVGRVWPLHVAVLGLFILNECAKLAFSHWIPPEKPPFTGDTSIGSIFTNLLMIQSLGIHRSTTWNFPSWSISVEFYTYVVFAAVMHARRHTATLFALLALLGFLMLAFYSPGYMDATYDFGIFRCIYGFSLGVLTYKLYAHSALFLEKRKAWANLAECAAMAIAVLYVACCGHGPSSLFAPLPFACVIYIFAFEGGIPASWLRTKPIQALGLWSYSIYTMHAFLLICMEQALKLVTKFAKEGSLLKQTGDAFAAAHKSQAMNASWEIDALLAVYLITLVGLSALTYRLIEVPGKHWFNRIARSHHAPNLQPAPP